MNKFVNRLMRLLANRKNTKDSQSVLWVWTVLGICVTAYALPWVVNPGLSLSLGAFDLAEWVSLRLPYRPLDMMLLLRLPPVCIAVMVAFRVGHGRFSWNWWLGLGVVMMIGIALLPPIEFFTQFQDDVNYGQQFNLTVWVLVMGAVGLAGILPDVLHRLAVVVAGLAGVTIAVLGLTQAQALMIEFQLPVQIGFGGVLLITGFVGVIVWEFSALVRMYART